MNSESSNSSSKKRSHRLHNRTPKPYKWADIGTEALIYFTVVFGPWAFGTVHDWAVTTMNLANYGIGLLLLTKWMIRWKTGYQPARWSNQSKTGEDHTPIKRDWRTKTVAGLTVYMLGYILVSILNARSTYNWDVNFFEYEDSYIKWLPHTYDKGATIQSFCNFLGLACCFWGVRDWLLGKTRNERMESTSEEEDSQHMFQDEISVPKIPVRLKRLLWLLCISGGLLALVGIVQRLDGTPKLLWILEREKYGSPTQGFGPFGYRGNGASYINMILPISFGFLMWMLQYANSVRMKSGQKPSEAHFTLIPAIGMMVAAVFTSLNRGGVLVLGCMIILGSCWVILRPKLMSSTQYAMLGTILLSGLALSTITGWEQLVKRIKSNNIWYETLVERPNSEEKITLICDLPKKPYSKNYQLFFVTNSKSAEFRKSYFQSTLTMDGRLQTLLYNHINKSYIETIYTNLTEALKSDQLKLEITRNSSGLNTVMNGVSLNGNQNSRGTNPPSWDHPVVPNEILLYRNPYLKMSSPDLKYRYLSIHPTTLKGKPIQNRNSVRLVFEKNWSLSHILSKMSSRERIYEDSWRMAKDFSWLGCGSGAWVSVYFLYHDADELWDAWVHCDWLEYWINFGLLGIAPGLILLMLTLIPIGSMSGILSQPWLNIILNIAIAGCLIHALFDFPLQVISIMHLFIILCAIKMIAQKLDRSVHVR